MYLTVFTGAIGKDYYIEKFMMGSSPHDEHRSSGPRPVKLCLDQYIQIFILRTGVRIRFKN